VLEHVKTTIRGLVTTTLGEGKVVLRPKTGPLDWEVCLEDARSPTYFSKNE
jgi:hypothetical protein